MITTIRSGHAKEFEFEQFESFVVAMAYFMCSWLLKKSQLNCLKKERKNRLLKEMARIMINAYNLPNYFLAKAINTTC